MADETAEDIGNIFKGENAGKLCTFLDENLKEDLSNVQECLERMQKEKLALEKQLRSSEPGTAAPSCVEKTVSDAKATLQNVDTIHCYLSELNSSVEEHNSKIASLVDQLKSLSNTVKELQSLSSYIKLIQKVEDHSDKIHHGLETGSLKKAAEELLCLKSLSSKLTGSSCHHLKQFVARTLTYWNKIVVDKLSKEFNDVLKVLKWPFTSGSTAPSLGAKSDVFTTLENLFVMLLKVSEINCVDSDNVDDLNTTKETKGITLPMELLLQPLNKRFQYHFYGNRQTNNLEKPEWFYTQVLNWLRDHEDFLDSTIQPILDKGEIICEHAQAQFTKGLLQLVVHKMERTIPLILNDDTIFSHFIDETLLFDEELRNAYSYPTVNSSCLGVLIQQPCFKKWVTLEKQYAMENVQMLLSSEKAWSPRYQDASDVDDLKVPECVETFVSLLLGITDRFKNFPDERKRLEFLNIQLDLIFFFTASIEEIVEQNVDGPLAPCFLFIMNSTNYLGTILQDWSEQTMFLKLYYTKRQIAKEKDEKHALEATSNDTFSPLDGPGTEDSILKTLAENDDSGTLFDEAIHQLKLLQNKMVADLVKHVVFEFKVKSESYKKESWHSLPSQKDLAITCLSPSFCDMMVYLREILGKLKKELVNNLFSCLWKQLADELSEFLFREIVLKCHFNEGGAAQLKFDVYKNLFVLFGQFTPKPENYFRKLKEAIILLNSMPGSAVLLKETMEESKRKTKPEISRSALDELGVYTLSVSKVLEVLSSRINWTK